MNSMREQDLATRTLARWLRSVLSRSVPRELLDCINDTVLCEHYHRRRITIEQAQLIAAAKLSGQQEDAVWREAIEAAVAHVEKQNGSG